MTEQKRAAEWLASGNVRPTKQRLFLAELLVGDGQHRHFCAESLFEAASQDDSAVSLATVYNTLKIFSDANLIQEVKVTGSRSYFDTRIDEHPHYYWEDSDTLTDAPKDAIELAKMPQAPEGAEIARVDIVLRLRKKS